MLGVRPPKVFGGRAGLERPKKEKTVPNKKFFYTCYYLLSLYFRVFVGSMAHRAELRNKEVVAPVVRRRVFLNVGKFNKLGEMGREGD